MRTEFEEFHLEETEEEKKRKKRKKREQMLNSLTSKGKKSLKNTENVLAVTGKLFYAPFKDDKFLSTFLDTSGIYKKPNYEKITADNMAEINKKLEEIHKILDA